VTILLLVSGPGTLLGEAVAGWGPLGALGLLPVRGEVDPQACAACCCSNAAELAPSECAAGLGQLFCTGSCWRLVCRRSFFAAGSYGRVVARVWSAALCAGVVGARCRAVRLDWGLRLAGITWAQSNANGVAESCWAFVVGVVWAHDAP
jgi:hypothetical protein